MSQFPQQPHFQPQQPGQFQSQAFKPIPSGPFQLPNTTPTTQPPQQSRSFQPQNVNPATSTAAPQFKTFQPTGPLVNTPSQQPHTASQFQPQFKPQSAHQPPQSSPQSLPPFQPQQPTQLTPVPTTPHGTAPQFKPIAQFQPQFKPQQPPSQFKPVQTFSPTSPQGGATPTLTAPALQPPNGTVGLKTVQPFQPLGQYHQQQHQQHQQQPFAPIKPIGQFQPQPFKPNNPGPSQQSQQSQNTFPTPSPRFQNSQLPQQGNQQQLEQYREPGPKLANTATPEPPSSSVFNPNADMMPLTQLQRFQLSQSNISGGQNTNNNSFNHNIVMSAPIGLNGGMVNDHNAVPNNPLTDSNHHHNTGVPSTSKPPMAQVEGFNQLPSSHSSSHNQPMPQPMGPHHHPAQQQLQSQMQLQQNLVNNQQLPHQSDPVINPNQMPRLQDRLETMIYQPQCGVSPPLVTNDFIVVSEPTNPFVSPRFLRLTHNAITQSQQTQEIPGIPFGGVVQPLAEPHQGEEPVAVRDVSTSSSLGLFKTSHNLLSSLSKDSQLTTNSSNGGFFGWFSNNTTQQQPKVVPQTNSLFDEISSNDPNVNRNDQFCRNTHHPVHNNTGNDTNVEEMIDLEYEMSVADLLGPLRCTRCRAYANPNFIFTTSNGGKTFTCNFCWIEQEVPTHWECRLDGNQLRADRFEKSEFSCASVEYIVPSFYSRIIELPKEATSSVSADTPELKTIQDTLQETTDRINIRRAFPRGQQPPSSQPLQSQSSTSKGQGKMITLSDHNITFTPHFVFVVDVSPIAVQHGVLGCIAESLKRSLEDLSQRIPRAKVALVCYNHTVFVPRLLKQKGEFAFVNMCDTQQPFLPIPAHHCFVSLSDDRSLEILNNVLRDLPTMFKDTTHLIQQHQTQQQQQNQQQSSKQSSFITENCLGSALQIAYYLLEQKGGKVLSFISSVPNMGIGSAPPQFHTTPPVGINTAPLGKQVANMASMYNTDAEQDFYQHNSYYHMLGVYAAYNSISFDIYACSTREYCHLSMFNDLCRLSAGQIYLYRSFNRYSDGQSLSNDIQSNLLRNTGFNALMTIRCSAGIELGEYYGNCFIPHKNEILLSTIDSHKSIGFTLNYSQKQLTLQTPLKSDGNNSTTNNNNNLSSPFIPTNKIYVQVALLFHSILGDTRIRVHTQPIDIVDTLQPVYRSLDHDAIMNLLLKRSLAYNFNPTHCYFYQESLSLSSLTHLYAYRKHCARQSSSGQLILPDKLKLLPLYILATAKSALLRQGLHADERAFLLSYLRSLPCHVSSTLLVPRLYALTCNMGMYKIDNNIQSGMIFTQVSDQEDTLGQKMPSYNNNNDQLQQYQNQNHSTAITHYQQRTRVYLPNSLSLSINSLAQDQIFLMDDTTCIYIWVGHLVPLQLRSLLFQEVEPPTTAANQLGLGGKVIIKSEDVTILRDRPLQPSFTLPPQPTANFNPYLFYAHNLLHKIHNILDCLHSDKSLYQKVRIINALSLPRVQQTDNKGQANTGSTGLRTMDEINFTKKLIEDTAPIPTRGYSSDAKSWSYSLPGGTSITIPASNDVMASQRAAVMNYVDYLVWAHRSILAKLSTDKS